MYCSVCTGPRICLDRPSSIRNTNDTPFSLSRLWPFFDVQTSLHRKCNKSYIALLTQLRGVIGAGLTLLGSLCCTFDTEISGRVAHAVEEMNRSHYTTLALYTSNKRLRCHTSAIVKSSRHDSTVLHHTMMWSWWADAIWRSILKCFTVFNFYWTYLLNPLKINGILLYLKTQFVPRSKHFSSLS